MRIAAVVAATGLALAAGFGVGILARSAVPADTPFALYLTDAPANLTRLDVVISSVTVGDGIPLDVVSAEFDLASLQGPRDALLVAQGNIPVGIQGPITVRFAAVHATIGDVKLEVPDPADLVLGSISAGLPDAALLDVDLPATLREGPGGLRFEPVLQGVFTLPRAAAGESLSWESAPRLDPATIGAAFPIGSVAGDAQELGAVPLAQPDVGSTVAVDIQPTEAGLKDPIPPSAAAETRTGWLVEFADANAREYEMRAAVKSSGAVFVQAFETFPIAYVLANPFEADELLEQESVAGLEPEVSLQFLDAESRAALRMPEVVHPLTGLRDAAGNPIDGRGVGIAVVDTGIDARHPDLAYAPLVPGGPIVANYKVASLAFLPLVDTDTTSGHGTHVAGIIAGQGQGGLAGMAPGASIYGFGVGDAATNVWAAQAFDWIAQHHDEVDPPIRIVTNSWSTGTEYSPRSIIVQFVNHMVGQGLVVVFSAGNGGGNGLSAQTSAECKIPTAGVICVAAYDDLGSGTRSGQVAPYSSRGAIVQPGTWPDISAPGTSVTSTRSLAGITSGVGLSNYVELSGTSQAAPHVAAVAALMLQDNAALTPAAVEASLKSSAHKFSDGGPYVGGSHFAKGAGLVDAYAAILSV